MAKTLVETYLGCKIYYITPPDATQAVYSSPCVATLHFKKSAVKKRICTGQGGIWDGTSCSLPEKEILGEFRFASYSALDTRELFPVGATWPSLSRSYKVGESVYVHYCVKNVGGGAGKATITVKDLDTGATITTWSSPELDPNERFKTSGSGAYVGKMPEKEWRIEFKVTP